MMVGVLVAVAAFSACGIAAMVYFRQRACHETLRDVQRRLYVTQARLNEMESFMQKELQTLRALTRRQSGEALFVPSMKIADAIAIDARVRDVLAQFHLGGCSSCAINEDHSIEQAASSYGIDLERLMAALAALGDNSEVPQNPPHPARLLQLTEF
jgi:hybrid cluster-associated redox disulfide protein